MIYPIKFRGRHIATGGKMVYGDLIQSGGEASIFDGNHRFYVYPDSVAQLVGVDKDGNEVYEGDLVTDKNGYEGFAALLPIVDDVFVTDVGCCSYFCDKCKLKEARP